MSRYHTMDKCLCFHSDDLRGCCGLIAKIAANYTPTTRLQLHPKRDLNQLARVLQGFYKMFCKAGSIKLRDIGQIAPKPQHEPQPAKDPKFCEPNPPPRPPPQSLQRIQTLSPNPKALHES